MNRKQLIIAAMATVLSVTAASASSINGTSQSGTFTIDPVKVNGDVGYRKYSDFTVSSGDVANLNFYHSGKARNIETFINLVQKQIDIQGVLNTTRNGNYHNGHAVFVSPNGMVVGSSGVLNVGRLSVITPTSTKYNSLTGDYDNDKFENINKVSQLKKLGTDGSGNADINIQGYVFARDGIDLPGKDVTVSGKVLNGLAEQNKISTSSAAETLFNSLVNTNGTIKATTSQINSNGTLLFVNAANSANVSGKVVNLTAGADNNNNGSLAITSGNGSTISGYVTANGKLAVYNKGGNMDVAGTLRNSGGELSVTNNGTGSMTLQKDAAFTNATGDVNIINNSTGALTDHANATATKGKLTIVNEAGGAATIDGENTATAKNVRIVNRGNGLTLQGTTTAGTDISVRNYGKSNNVGLTQSGTLEANNGILVDNYNGSATINGTINSAGNVAVMNRANDTAKGYTTGALTTGANSNIQAGNILAIKNASTGGMNLQGTVKNTGAGTYKGNATTAKHETAINNLAGTMTVNGTVNTKGNMGIINKGSGKMTVGADIDSNGKLKLANVNGSGFDINNTIDNQNGNLSIYNEKGLLTVNGKVNNDGGYLFAYSRGTSSGIKTTANSELTTTGIGETATKTPQLAIKHNGTGTASGANGIDLNGKVANNSNVGQVAINNYKGNTHVGGTVSGKNAMGIINREGSGDMNVDATINATNNNQVNIRNTADTGNITVGGTINHNGRLNLIANDGTLTLDGDINNTSNLTGAQHYTYAIARQGADGVVTTSNFDAESTKGMIWIRNRGNNGLTHDGVVNSTGAQAELQNYAGNLTVNGTVKGNKAVVLNRGRALNVSDTAVLNNTESATQLYNYGSAAGTIADKYKGIYHQDLNHQ